MKKNSPQSPSRLALVAFIFCALATIIWFTTTVKRPQPTQLKPSADTSATDSLSAKESRDAAVKPAGEIQPQPAGRAPVIAHQTSRKDQSLARSIVKRDGDEQQQIATAARESTTERMEEERDEVRPDQPDEALRWRRLSLVDEHGQIPEGALLRAWKQARQMPVESVAWPVSKQSKGNLDSTTGNNIAGIQPNGWTWLGPGNVGGRIRSIVIHPTTPQTIWIGSVSGGIWKTTDGGATWAALNDFMANLAVTCMVIDPTNANVIYAGTGEGFGNTNALRGAGIFKTTDGGTTWTQLNSTNNQNFWFVNRLTINPTNNQIILAATQSGIWRSTDGGTTWTQASTRDTLDVVFNPGDGTKAIASGTTVAHYSTDGGASWNNATGITGARIEVAYSRSNPSIVYAGVNNNKGEVYRSTNGGQTYTLVSAGTNYLGDQGWYDNCVWIDPTNSNTVIVGGIDLWRSTDGGQNFTKISRWQSAPPFGVAPNISAHADNHIIIESPQFNGTTNKTVFFGNDGGLFRADDFSTVAEQSGWTSLNSTIGITQFYGAAGNPTSGRIVGGTQDNGTVVYGGGTNTWQAIFGGDGGWCASDPTDPNYFYGEYIYLQIHRSTNGAQAFSSTNIYEGLTDAEQQKGNFIAPFILDPNNPNTLLGGADQLWRSTNVKAATPNWTAIKPSVNANISAVAVAKGNSDIIWVGHNDGSVYYSTNGTSANPTWTQADLGTPNLPGRYCTRITIDPTNPNRVYVTFGGFSAGNVWRTDNNGANWTNVSGNLPSAPVRTLAVWQQNPGFLYVGTEVGIFASADGGTTWSATNDGPANCSVDELFWMNNTLVAATHGRGLFSIPISAAGCTYTLSSASQNFTAAGGANTVNVTATAGCLWTAVSNSPFITITSGANGTGNGTVSYTVAANLTTNTRTGTITIAGQTFTVTQDAAAVAGPTLQLSATAYTVNEGDGFATITVNRTGDTSQPVTIKYATDDATDVNFKCDPNTAGQVKGIASRKCDYHLAVGRLRFAAGETTKQIAVSIVDDVYVEGPETFTLTLSNPTGATLGANTTATITIIDNDTVAGAPNPIDGTRFYVRQLYVDLLSREPDPAGWNGWISRIDLCGQPGQAPGPCDRVTVGGDGFLRSAEFFDRQFFVLRLYRTGLGRIPQYSEVGDLAYVSGFLSNSDLELNKQELVADIMSRTEFSNKYNGLSNLTFVDVLLATAGVTVDTATHDGWVNSLNNSSQTRAQVYRAISERQEVSAKFLNEAQVISAYYGFFTRNPDGAYFDFLDRLNRGVINLGDLANAFINAVEYRQRFAP